jgi:hypothetical protein
VGQQAFALSKNLSAADVLTKLGDDGINQSPSFATPAETQNADDGNRVRSRTRNAPHGASHPQPDDPFDFSSSTESGDEALARMRREHQSKVAAKYSASIDAKVKAGMSRADAITRTLRDMPDAKSLSGSDLLNAANGARR